MNIVIAAKWYAITAAAEYFYRAFKNILPNANVIRVGTYHGRTMPYRNGNCFVKSDYVVEPEVVIPDNTLHVPAKYVESELQQIGINNVDLWLDVNAGFFISEKPKKGGVRCLFATDPHTGLMQIYQKTSLYYDFIFNPQTQYPINNHDREIYLPYAADAEWFAAIPDEEKIFDVSLIGNLYDKREAYFREISKKYTTFFDVGKAKKDAGNIYSQSRVGFSWSSELDLVCRVFEVGLSGIVPLFNRVPDIFNHFKENEDFIGFDNLNEALDKTDEILKNYEKYVVVGQNLHNKVQKEHLWEHRVQKILSIIK